MAKGNRQRASRHIRPDNPKPMLLTERDKEVVKAVNDYRVLRQDQVQRLLFPSRNTAQERLRKLWEHGYLRREFLPVIGGVQTSPILYVLDKRGAELLVSKFGYDSETLRWSPRKSVGHQFLEHMVGVAEIRLAVTLSCKRHDDYELKTVLDEKTLKGDYDKVKVGREWVAVIPDAYFVIGVPAGAVHFFVEFDRGSERLKVFEKKIAAYLAYYRSSKCKARYGTDKIRVLTVIEGGQSGAGRARLANLKELALELGDRRRFWFSSLAEIAEEDFLSAAIWWTAGKDKPGALLAPESKER